MLAFVVGINMDCIYMQRFLKLAVILWDGDGQTLLFLMTMYADFGEPHPIFAREALKMLLP